MTQPSEEDLRLWQLEGWERINLWHIPEGFFRRGTGLRLRSHEYGWHSIISGTPGWSWIDYNHPRIDPEDLRGSSADTSEEPDKEEDINMEGEP